jgi:peptidoglycan/LPS O-acetylase OafA/YrhL
MRGRNFWILEKTQKINRHLADFSYSLYLIHFPIMLLVLALLHRWLGLEGIANGYSPTSVEGLMIYGFIMLFIYGLAWSFSRLTEAQTFRVRRALKTVLCKD